MSSKAPTLIPSVTSFTSGWHTCTQITAKLCESMEWSHFIITCPRIRNHEWWWCECSGKGPLRSRHCQIKLNISTKFCISHSQSISAQKKDMQMKMNHLYWLHIVKTWRIEKSMETHHLRNKQVKTSALALNHQSQQSQQQHLIVISVHESICTQNGTKPIQFI